MVTLTLNCYTVNVNVIIGIVTLTLNGYIGNVNVIIGIVTLNPKPPSAHKAEKMRYFSNDEGCDPAGGLTTCLTN